MSANNNNPAKQDKIRRFYDEVYYETIPETVGTSRHLRRLASKIGIQSGQRVLDIACGTGEWLLAVVEAGAKPAGIDISQRAIDVCQHNIPQGDFHVGSAESLPFADNQFDVVSCLGSLEHFLNPETALREMIRVAQRDAKILLLVPNADFLTYRLGLFSGTNQADVHEEIRNLEEWQKLFESSGMRVKARWRDLHILSWSWIYSKRWYMIPVRAIQAFMLLFWPLSWQYQIYFLCQEQNL
jgi:ubiquinone/menaquinone biosynthesis C-methylase UbiE